MVNYSQVEVGEAKTLNDSGRVVGFDISAISSLVANLDLFISK